MVLGSNKVVIDYTSGKINVNTFCFKLKKLYEKDKRRLENVMNEIWESKKKEFLDSSPKSKEYLSTAMLCYEK